MATEAGGYALLTAGLTEGAQVLRTDADGTVTWKKTYADRGEPTALAVLESDGKATGFGSRVKFLLFGYNGAGTTPKPYHTTS